MRRKKYLVVSEAVTSAELAQKLGEQLLIERTRRQMSPEDVHKRGGPTAPTVRTLEQGRIAPWTKLIEYCEALELALPDILSALLGPPRLTAEQSHLLELYDGLGPRARAALILIAEEVSGRASGHRTK